MLPASVGLILAAAEDGPKQLLQPVGIEQAVLDVADHHAVELVHGDRTALAARFALPRLDRAGIVAIAAALAGADGHGSPAIAAIADAGEQRRPDDDPRRHLNGDDLLLRLQLLGLGPLVELVLANIGAPGQDTVDLPNTPAPAVAGEDAPAVEVFDDGLDPHLAR
ncbi:hypothetical protein M3484_01200 [Pseudomonas sp. GX19020]|uniref:hypothetical protein n=1 Tax=Pseudomonas sp. GX19020 TaxID=2942277 RepID=UPI002019F721|nr:hypothetical protein [Pseudomonas sp. GX19020]MCL4065192.1 hypothetical protein [Pseudomonas sp. GX19020]